MLKKLPLAALLLLAVISLRAQTFKHCGYNMVIKHYEQIDPTFKKRYDALYQQPATQRSHSAAKTTGTIYQIPVVFHVVYNNADQNVPDSVIQNQLQVLNDAYRKRHADTGNVRTIFKPLSEDAEIEFYFATTDPQGQPTNGITRTYTSKAQWGDLNALLSNSLTWLENIKTTDSGGIDPWPTSRYLNIWVADMSVPVYGPLVMGISTPPINPLPPNWTGTGFDSAGMKDGVVLQYQVVGNNSPTLGSMVIYGQGTGYVGSAGRTAVHEVGHYLGMRHIWGDADASNSCTPAGDDGIADTPPQATESAEGFTCPNATQNTCGAADTADLPDMWENYMDYSRDNCQAMFTHGQVDLMRSVAANQRDTLINQSPTAIAATLSHESAGMTLYPIPATNAININFTGVIQSVRINNMLGQEVARITGATAGARRYDVSSLPAGNYLLTVQDANRTYTQRMVIRR